HLALGAELSADFTERTRVMSLNTLMQAMGAYGFGYFAYSYFFKSTPEFENGMLNSAAYVDLAITAALLGGAIMLLSTVATMRVIPRLSLAPANLPRFSIKEFFSDCQSALNNRNYLMLLLGYLLLSATLGTRETLGIHVNTYYWELVPSQIRYFTLVGMVAPIIGFLVTAPLHERFEKKPVLIFGLIGLLVCSSSPVTLRIFGLMPENHSDELL
ncbi:MAG: MFS transporter, partial [Pseudomonadales bacterium]